MEIGKYVKCFLRNGMVLEGVVEKSPPEEVVLKSLDGQSLMILHRPAEDIMMTKVMLVEPAEITTEIQSPIEPTEIQIKEKLQEAQEQLCESDLHNMTIEELRQLVIQQEHAIIAQKKKEHFGTAGNAKLTHYSYPSNITKHSTYQTGKLPPWVK